MILISPTWAVFATCVPPHADQSKPATSTMRMSSVTFGGLRSGMPASASGATKVGLTASAASTIALAAASTRANASASRSLRFRSIVLDAAPRWKPTVSASHVTG